MLVPHRIAAFCMNLAVAIPILISSATITFADDTGTPDTEMAARIAAAEAKLRAKSAAATQPDSSNDPAVLHSIIQEQKQEIELLKDRVAALTLDPAANRSDAQPAGSAGVPAEKQPLNGPTPHGPKRQTTTTSTYDRFRDETSIKTPEMIVNLTKNPLQLTELSVTFYALFKGGVVERQTPGQLTADCALTGGNLASIGANEPLIVLLDGKPPGIQITNTGVDQENGLVFCNFQFDSTQLRRFARAKTIEGQLGISEFDLSPMQVAEIADFYEQTSPDGPAPAAKQRASDTASAVKQKRNDPYPSIAGEWQEAPGVALTISQNGGQWTARCTYKRADFGEVRWEMAGTITAEGAITGMLHHTRAPPDWAQTQIRVGQLSPDGKMISGTAKWHNGGDEFTWSRLTALVANTATQPSSSVDSAPAAEPVQQSPPPNTVVLTPRAFSELPKDARGKPASFGPGIKVGDVGYIVGSQVESVVDEKTAIVSIATFYNTSGPGGVDSQRLDHDLVIQGLATDGQADNMGWYVDHWFKITGTAKIHGTTYLVAQPIVEGR